jgi:hypothetical protein
LQANYGPELDMNKSTENTIKLFDEEESLAGFLETSQARFWEKEGSPFKRLAAEECQKELPLLGKSGAPKCNNSKLM